MSPPGQGGADGGKKGAREQAGSAVSEVLVRGVVGARDVGGVLAVVNLLCPDTGHAGEFRTWDRVYNVGSDVRAPKFCVRLRAHLGPGVGAAAAARPAWARYSLMHYGLMDRRAPAPVEKRPVHVVAVGDEAALLLKTLGCALVHEYVRRGSAFRTRAGLLVEVFAVEKLAVEGEPSSAVRAGAAAAAEGGGDGDGDFVFVEVSSDRGAAPEDVLTFMSYLTAHGVLIRK